MPKYQAWIRVVVGVACAPVTADSPMEAAKASYLGTDFDALDRGAVNAEILGVSYDEGTRPDGIMIDEVDEHGERIEGTERHFYIDDETGEYRAADDGLEPR